MPSITSSATRTLLAWVAIASLSGLAAIVTWRLTMISAERVTRTIVIEQQLARWLTAAQDIETGQRGYLLTEDKTYLAPYARAKAESAKIVVDLSKLVAGNADQMALLDEIEKTLQAQIRLVEETIARVEAGKPDSARDMVRSGQGRTNMDHIRERIAHAQAVELRYFEERIAQYRRQSLGLLAAVVATLLASAGLAMLALTRERQRVAGLEISAQALTSANRSLEERVRVRTQELAVERDRATASSERAEALLRDVTHRIGNTLALVVGFINLHIRHTTDRGSIKTLTGARDRIHAIASTQRRINVANDLELVRIDTLIEAVMDDIVRAAGKSRIALKVDVPPVLAPAQVATSLCVLTQEFVVNSLKHAFADDDDGAILVAMVDHGDEGAELIVEDDGRGMPEEIAAGVGEQQDRDGLGTKIAGLLMRQFDGTIHCEPADGGRERVGTRVIVRLASLRLIASVDDGAPDVATGIPSASDIDAKPQ